MFRKNTKLTFLVIPDANSAVVRFRISKYMLYLCAALLILLVIGSAIIYYLRLDSVQYAKQLEISLSQSESLQSEQNATINELHKQVIALNNQAKQVQVKLEEMQKLGETVIDIANPSSKNTSPKVTALSESGQSGGIGGSLNEVTSEEMLQLSKETQQLLTKLDGQMSDVKDSLIEAKAYVERKQYELAITPSIWPSDSRRVTSEFGYRIDPISKRASFHSGLDISADMNTPVQATADGVVESTGYDRAPGNHIMISHPSGLKTHFMHLNKILVQEGDVIKKGDIIALSGNTGRSTGPHIHYEIIKDGISIDPTPYLDN